MPVTFTEEEDLLFFQPQWLMKVINSADRSGVIIYQSAILSKNSLLHFCSNSLLQNEHLSHPSAESHCTMYLEILHPKHQSASSVKAERFESECMSRSRLHVEGISDSCRRGCKLQLVYPYSVWPENWRHEMLSNCVHS